MAGYDPLTVEKLAAAFYRRAEKKDGGAGYPYSPAAATKEIAKKTGAPHSRLVPIVASVYYSENGKRSPLPIPKTKRTEARIAAAVRARRDAGGRLGRWEVIAVSLSETLGRPVAVAAVRSLYLRAGGSETASYTGRGTRVGAPDTRGDEAAEVVATL